MQAKEEHIELGHISLAYYKSSKGTLNIGLTSKVVNWVGQATRLAPTRVWNDQGMLCLQMVATRNPSQGYRISSRISDTYPYRCICTTQSSLMKGIKPFGALTATILGLIVEGEKTLIIAAQEDRLGDVREQAMYDRKAVKPEKSVSAEVVAALNTINKQNLPETEATVSILKRAINSLVEPLSLELSVNSLGQLEIVRYTKKNL